MTPAWTGCGRRPPTTRSTPISFSTTCRATDWAGPANGRFVVKWMLERSLVGIAALQVGVAEEALRQAADYTSDRIQFGRPLSTFQGTALKAADAYIDTEAMRVTLWQAAWRFVGGLDAAAAVDGGQVVGI